MEPKGIAELIRESWEKWAAIAYSRFLASGRGVLRLTIPESEDLIEPRISTFYINSALAEEVGGWPTKQMEWDVGHYDPEEEVMIGLIDSDPDSSLLVVRMGTPEGLLSPREAYEAGKHEDRETGATIH